MKSEFHYFLFFSAIFKPELSTVFNFITFLLHFKKLNSVKSEFFFKLFFQISNFSNFFYFVWLANVTVVMKILNKNPNKNTAYWSKLQIKNKKVPQTIS